MHLSLRPANAGGRSIVPHVFGIRSGNVPVRPTHTPRVQHQCRESQDRGQEQRGVPAQRREVTATSGTDEIHKVTGWRKRAVDYARDEHLCIQETPAHRSSSGRRSTGPESGTAIGARKTPIPRGRCCPSGGELRDTAPHHQPTVLPGRMTMRARARSTARETVQPATTNKSRAQRCCARQHSAGPAGATCR